MVADDGATGFVTLVTFCFFTSIATAALLLSPSFLFTAVGGFRGAGSRKPTGTWVRDGLEIERLCEKKHLGRVHFVSGHLSVANSPRLESMEKSFLI